jgi:hypothetical protein
VLFFVIAGALSGTGYALLTIAILPEIGSIWKPANLISLVTLLALPALLLYGWVTTIGPALADWQIVNRQQPGMAFAVSFIVLGLFGTVVVTEGLKHRPL